MFELNRKYTTKELIEKISKDAEISKKAAEAALNSVLEGIETSLIEEGKITFVGFGTFEVRERAAREGRNPRTKEVIQIPATTVPVFKAGSAFKEKMN